MGFQNLCFGLLLWLGAGVGAASVHIGASSLLQPQPAHVAVASIRYIGHKDEMVYFSAIMPKFATFLSQWDSTL